MGYNYGKDWVENNWDTVERLLELAKTKGCDALGFETINDMENKRIHIRSCIAAASLHYPQHAADLGKIRTWKEIDRQTGEFILYFGDEQNYKAPGRTIKGKRTAERKLRGSKPFIPQAMAVHSRPAPVAPPVQPVKDPSTEGLVTWNAGETYTIDRLPELLADATILNDPNSVVGSMCYQLGLPMTRLSLPEAKLTIDELSKLGFALERVDESDPVTFLLFRKVGRSDAD